MGNYLFRATTEAGQSLTGLYRAKDAATVTNRLSQLGLAADRPMPVPNMLVPVLESFGSRTVPARELAVLMRQFAVMYQSGVPLVRALECLEASEWTTQLAIAVRVLGRSIHSGLTLSEGMRLSPQVFTPAAISLVKTGEITGRMAESLNHCADLMEGEADLKGKVGAALVYPAFITVLFMLAGVLIAFLVLPRFAEILAGFDRQLPLPALLLLKFVQVAFQPWVFLVGLEASLLGWFLAAKSPEGGAVVGQSATCEHPQKNFAERSQRAFPVCTAQRRVPSLAGWAERGPRAARP